MPSAKEIVEQAESLPVEDRLLVVDSLLRPLNPPDAQIDRKWADVATRRLAELRSVRVTPLPGDEVLARARERFRRCPSRFTPKRIEIRTTGNIDNSRACQGLSPECQRHVPHRLTMPGPTAREYRLAVGRR